MNIKSPTSVIIPCYNSEKTIGRALDSVLNQTLDVSEIIIIDDQSKDDTIKKVLEYKVVFETAEIKFDLIVNDRNKGASFSRNVGLQKANGQFVAFLDSDDIWHSQKVELQSKIMEENPDVYCIGGYQAMINNEMAQDLLTYLNKDILDSKMSKVNEKKALFKNPTQTSVVFFRNDKSLFFDENKRLSEDFLLWLNIILSGRKMVQLKEPVAALFKSPYGESGLSSNMVNMELNEIDTLIRIKREYSKGVLDNIIYIGAILFSVLKFIRRMVKVSFTKMKRSTSNK